MIDLPLRRVALRWCGWGNKEIKLTGNPDSDELIAENFLHPAIAIIPIREGSQSAGRVLFYQLSVRPFFTDPPEEYVSKQALKAYLDFWL